MITPTSHILVEELTIEDLVNEYDLLFFDSRVDLDSRDYDQAVRQRFMEVRREMKWFRCMSCGARDGHTAQQCPELLRVLL